MMEQSFTGPNGKVFYYDGTPEDRERAEREAELEYEGKDYPFDNDDGTYY